VLFCVHVVQIDNNESSWREKKKQLSNGNKQKKCANLLRKQKILIKKYSWQDTQANNYELKLNINHNIKISKITTFFKSNNV